MNSAQTAFELAMSETDKLRRTLRKGTSAQVTSTEERTNAKASALSWYNTHRSSIVVCLGDHQLAVVDKHYNDLLIFCEKSTTRKKYDDTLKALHQALVELRTKNIVSIANAAPIISTDKPPDFSTLVSDPDMRGILLRRWSECIACVDAKAPLAATVMMGGLLETLLLTRVLQSTDKSKVFGATNSPKDKAGKALPLSEWTLRNYIDVAHELGWITQTEKDLGVVLRDYRNYIHPHKELSHRITLEPNDAAIIWELSKNISRQLLGTMV